MASDIEVIEFKRPYVRESNLYLTGIIGNFDEEELVVKLTEIFSRYGLLYDVQVMLGKFITNVTVSEHQDACPRPKSYYAFVKFYSTKAAAVARQELNGQSLFNKGQPVSVKVANPRKSFDSTQHNLPLWKCTELADHYLGFNSFSTTIKSMMEDDDFLEEHIDAVDSTVRYMCIVKVEIPKHGIETEGVGIGEATYICKDVSTKGSAFGQAKKIACRRASENAFSKLLLVVLGDDRVMVEVDNTKPDLLEFMKDDVDSELIQVNHLEAVETEESAKENREGDMDDSSQLDMITEQVLLDLEQDV